MKSRDFNQFREFLSHFFSGRSEHLQVGRIVIFFHHAGGLIQPIE
jgi:hypothetical protein